MKTKKIIKIWNGRDIDCKGILYLAAYSRADACRMLVELYPYTTVSHWNREISIYFCEGCWGNSMDSITPERGVWQLRNQYSKNEIITRIYPIVK